MIEYLGHYSMVSPDDWPYQNFTPFELRHRLDDTVHVDREFLELLQLTRNACGFPLKVTSYYRSPEYNTQVSSTGPDGPHTTGKAADIGIAGSDAHKLLKVAFDMGFWGIGVNQKGPMDKRFIHLDMITTPPRPNVWSY